MVNPQNIEKHRWKKGQSGNPAGGRKKTLRIITEQLKQEGCEPVKPYQVMEAFELLLGLTFDELKKIAGSTGDKENKYPALVRIAAIELLGKKKAEYVEKMLDRAHWKPTQKLNVEVKKKEIDLSGLTEQELETLMAIQSKLDGNGELDTAGEMGV